MKSLSRALMVLTELSSRGHPLTLTDIANAVDLHKSTVHRMLATFVEYGLVRRDEAHRYVIGLGALELARAARGHTGPGPLVESALSTLRHSTGLTASYAHPRGGRMTYAAVLGCPETYPSTDVIGSSIPMHATALGKAYLAHRPRVEVDRYVARAPFQHLTPRTVTDAYGLLRSLARTRDRGFAVEDREYASDIRSVAAPVLDHDGLAVAAIAVTVPARLSQAGDVRRFATAVVASADRLGAGLLHDGPALPPLGSPDARAAGAALLGATAVTAAPPRRGA